MKLNVEALRMNFTLSNGRVKANLDRIKALEENGPVVASPIIQQVQGESKGSSGVDMNSLNALFASKDSIAKLEKRISRCE